MKPVGNNQLNRFDVLIIGSGAGGSAAASILTRYGKKVLILEAGSNYFEGLDNPDPKAIKTLFSNDELKTDRRFFIMPDPNVEPRTFRHSHHQGNRTFTGDVNHLPKTVGGGGVHADLKMVRFWPSDFQLGRHLTPVRDANFADWPIGYDHLEKFYLHMEREIGVQGPDRLGPFDGRRSGPFPMPPGVPTYSGLKAAEAAKKLGYHPFPYPTAVNSQPYDGRPACNDCGYCGVYGCATHAKGSPAVTTLRHALLTGNCQLLPETRAVKLLTTNRGRTIAGVEAICFDGSRQVFSADQYVLAASPIEDVRLLLMSDPGGVGIGNSSGLVGRNIMFHLQTILVGIFEERLHGYRGRTVDHGMSDFRGIPGDPSQPLGGIMEFGTGGAEMIREALEYSDILGISGGFLRELMKTSPLRDRLMVLTMQAEDAPQLNNVIDLDPEIKDLDGLPVPRITYKNHRFELDAREFYIPKMLDLLEAAGARYAFIAPIDDPPASRHVLGTLRFGANPRFSVCNPQGRFHDVDNLYCADGALFPTSSGFNPTLTIMALGARVGAAMMFAESPELAIW